MTEGKLGVLAVLNRNAKHALEERQQLPLRWRHDRSRDLRLLPENLPVVLLRRPHAVQLRLPRPALAAREKLTKGRVQFTHSTGEDRVRALERRDLRSAQKQRIALLDRQVVYVGSAREIERGQRIG